MTLDRRSLFSGLIVGAAAPAVATPASARDAACESAAEPTWGRGPEGQRIADLGDGTFRIRSSRATTRTRPS